MKDIVVGIPSLNNKKTIFFVTTQIAKSLTQDFSKYKSEIVNADGGSTDKTPEIFLKTKTPKIEKISVKEKGPKGKGSAEKAVFEIAKKEGASVVATFDGDLESITPSWVKSYLSLVLEKGYDLVTPYYNRHKYDATITNTIAYPLTTALYGKRIRQPIGGDFAFSRKLFLNYLKKDVWQTSVAKFGIDIFETTTATAEDYKICQAYLGPKIHQSKDPHGLTSMFVEVVGTMFDLVRIYQDKWSKIKKIEEVPIFGQKSRKKAPFYPIDLGKLKGYDRISKDFWVKTVYDFLISKKPIEKLIPYYLRAVVSLIFDDWNPDDLVLEFLKQKPYLINKWKND